MRISATLLSIFAGTIVVGCLLGPPVHIFLRVVLGEGLGIEYLLGVPFNRVLSRIFMVLVFLFLFTLRRRLRIAASMRESLLQRERWFFLLRSGLGIGVVSAFALTLVLSAFGALRFHAFEHPMGWVLGEFAKALLTGVVVGFIEEIFFRGFILQGLRREMRIGWALGITSFFYAILHYFKARPHVYLEHFDWSAGFSTATRFLAPFHDVPVMIPGVTGLFLVGVVLGLAYLRTGSLYLSIGIHAGWVFMMKFDGAFSSRVGGVSPWFGDDKLVTGVVCWGMLLAVGAVVWGWGKRLAKA